MRSKTYNYGPSLEIQKDLTKNDYIKLCNQLSKELSEHANKNLIVKPEAISEGGFLIIDQNNPIHYKTMRHHIEKGKSKFVNKWPWISEKVMEDWNNNDEIIFYKGNICKTFLKAFHTAPVWTLEELNIFENRLSEFGIICKNIPKKSSLTFKYYPDQYDFDYENSFMAKINANDKLTK